MRVLLSLALVLSLAGCVSPQTMQAQVTNARIADLEMSARKLQSQYNQMGTTLNDLQRKLKALKQSQNVPAPAKPIVPPAPPASAPAQQQPTELAPALPTPPAPPTAPAEKPAPVVKPLTADDLEVTAPPKQAEAAPVTKNEVVYLVHLASYLDTAPIRHGWKLLSVDGAGTLDHLKPYLTPFKDDKGRNWLRLSAGLLDTRDEANKLCAAYKASGKFCDVISSPRNAARPLN